MSLFQELKDKSRPLRNYCLTAVMLAKLFFHQRLHQRSAILIATPIHRNLGDQAIVLAQREFLSDRFPDLSIFEICRFQYELSRELIERLVRPCDLIVIDGGGNVGTLWPAENKKMNDIVQRFSNNAVVVFPQTAYFSDDETGKACKIAVSKAYSSNSNLVFFSRDKLTYETVGLIAPDAVNLFVPDIVLYHNATLNHERHGALLCLRDDKERTLGETAFGFINLELVKRGFIVNETTTVVSSPRRIGEWNRNEILKAKWEEWSSSEIVVTDRLHGMIFSAITGTPCVALDNVSHKVSQGNEWIRYIPNIRVAKNAEDVPALIDEVLSIGPLSYDRTPLLPFYASMEEAISVVLD